MIVNAIFFVFINLSLFLVLAFADSLLFRSHFQPFTDVLRKMFGSLTQKVSEFFEGTADYTDGTDEHPLGEEPSVRSRRVARSSTSLINAAL